MQIAGAVGCVMPDRDRDFDFCALVTRIRSEQPGLKFGIVLGDALKESTRWIGVVGNPRLRGPHHELLAALGWPAEEVARVHRPIGLNIGSRAPAEIAISTLAGLLADRNDRPGGFTF